jgi:hypothetical protein
MPNAPLDVNAAGDTVGLVLHCDGNVAVGGFVHFTII